MCSLLLICQTSRPGVVFCRYVTLVEQVQFCRYATLVKQMQSVVDMLHQCIRCILLQICYTNVGSGSLLQICYTNVGRCSLLQIYYTSGIGGLLLVCCTTGACVVFCRYATLRRRCSFVQICYTSGAGVVFCWYVTLMEQLSSFLQQWNMCSLLLICHISRGGVVFCRYVTLVEQVQSFVDMLHQ